MQSHDSDRRLRQWCALVLACFALQACGPEPYPMDGPIKDVPGDGFGEKAGDDDGTDRDKDSGDPEPSPDPSIDDPGGCHSRQSPANRARRVVISLPYATNSAPSNHYRVYELTEAGDLVDTGDGFEMGRATDGVIVFSPDGQIGFVPQKDGTLGVFAFEDDGSVRVIHDRFSNDKEFYVGSLAVDPDGERVYVLDQNWRENGGGIYSLRFDCDGSLHSEGQLLSAKLSRALFLLSGGRALLAADDAMSSVVDQDVHLIDWTGEPAWTAGAAAYPDRTAITSGVGLTHDEHFVLLGDIAAFSGIPNRVAIVQVGDDTLEPVQILTPVLDPYSIEMSPFDRGGLVVSGFGDAIYRLVYDGGAQPYSIEELRYEGRRPQLPGAAVSVDRGELRGRVLIGENTAIRQVEFRVDGSLVDLGPTSTGDGVGAIVGAIGIQP